MAIAYAVLKQLVASTGCKTLFITHYPLVATELEEMFPARVENIHVGYHTEKRGNDGRRDVTFLYRLTKGIARGRDFALFIRRGTLTTRFFVLLQNPLEWSARAWQDCPSQF